MVGGDQPLAGGHAVFYSSCPAARAAAWLLQFNSQITPDGGHNITQVAKCVIDGGRLTVPSPERLVAMPGGWFEGWADYVVLITKCWQQVGGWRQELSHAPPRQQPGWQGWFRP